MIKSANQSANLIKASSTNLNNLRQLSSIKSDPVHRPYLLISNQSSLKRISLIFLKIRAIQDILTFPPPIKKCGWTLKKYA